MQADSLLRLVLELTEEITSAPTCEDAFAAILRSFGEAGGWAVGQVWIPSPDGECLQCSPVCYQTSARYDGFHAASRAIEFAKGTPLLGELWTLPEVRWVHGIGEDGQRFVRAGAAAAHGLDTALVVPVIVDCALIGVLEFFSGEPRPADTQTQNLLLVAAAQLGSLMSRRAAELELRRSEALFKAVAETAHDAIITIDRDGRIQYVNDEAAHMFGHPREAFTDEPVSMLIPPRLHAAHWQGFGRHLETGERHLIGRTTVVPALRSDDKEFPVELSLATWSIDGSPSFTAIVRDVSERERMHEELQRALTYEREAAIRLLESDRLKDAFLDTVSHDLRAPLAAIRAVTELLERDAERPILTPEQRTAHLAGLRVSADKMRRLLDDLLDLERLTAGSAMLDRRDADLAEIVRRCLNENSEQFVGRSVETDLPSIQAYVDVGKVERVVENLLINAVRHTPEGTAIAVSLADQDDEALIRVDDNGSGVADDMREAVFERFIRADGDVTGCGLGLSLVARLAEAHGGRAWVQSNASGGASFRVRLPRRAETVAHG